MNDLTPIGGNFNAGVATMSSREIADICEKQHAHVMRDTRAMLDAVFGGQSNSGSADFEAEYFDEQGKPRREYRLPRDLTMTLITGYRADLRYKVIKRLESLEAEKAKGGFQVPQSFGDALRLAADQSEQIEAMRPKVEAMDLMEASEGSQTPRIAAKVFDAAERKFFRWLHAHNWTYKQGKTWLGYSDKIKLGYLEHEPFTYTVPETGEEKTKVQLKITPKGMARLAQIFAKEGLPK